MVRTRPHSGGSLGTLYIVWRHLTSHPDRTQHYHISTFHSLGLRESFLYSILRELLRSLQHPAKVRSNVTSLMRPQCGWQHSPQWHFNFCHQKKKPTHFFFQKINKQYSKWSFNLMLMDENTEEKENLKHRKPQLHSFHQCKTTNGKELRNTGTSGTSQEHIDFQ